jgi:hypothetical protein
MRLAPAGCAGKRIGSLRADWVTGTVTSPHISSIHVFSASDATKRGRHAVIVGHDHPGRIRSVGRKQDTTGCIFGYDRAHASTTVWCHPQPDQTRREVAVGQSDHRDAGPFGLVGNLDPERNAAELPGRASLVPVIGSGRVELDRGVRARSRYTPSPSVRNVIDPSPADWAHRIWSGKGVSA